MKMNTKFKIFNAIELWQRENSLLTIPSFSKSLDKVLGNNGLPLCALTEVIGAPGSGKTQLCLQLCASVQVPATLGGLNAEALYIDTNTNFTSCRFEEILSASLSRCQKLLGIPIQINKDALMKLHYVNAFGLERYCAFMHKLPSFIEEHRNVKLIVIDSIAFPYKQGVSPRQRTGLLFRQMAELQRLAMEKQIAVLLTNEMSTRVGLSGGTTVGALGDAWAHRSRSRVLLAADERLGGGRRIALALKNGAPNLLGGFQISQEGIRDVD